MSQIPDKQVVLAEVIAVLQREQDTLHRAAQEAYEGATHAEVKQENKYDTRGLESGYLALGQSKRALEIGESITRLVIVQRDGFPELQKVGAGSLVECHRSDGQSQWYFLLPRVGGMKVQAGSFAVQVISTTSPLGIELSNREADDEVVFQSKTITIAQIC